MRPEGWDNPNGDSEADAMLEGLKKEGTHTNVVDDGLDIKGWRVFIPEDNNG